MTTPISIEGFTSKPISPRVLQCEDVGEVTVQVNTTGAWLTNMNTAVNFDTDLIDIETTYGTETFLQRDSVSSPPGIFITPGIWLCTLEFEIQRTSAGANMQPRFALTDTAGTLVYFQQDFDGFLDVVNNRHQVSRRVIVDTLIPRRICLRIANADAGETLVREHTKLAVRKIGERYIS